MLWSNKLIYLKSMSASKRAVYSGIAYSVLNLQLTSFRYPLHCSPDAKQHGSSRSSTANDFDFLSISVALHSVISLSKRACFYLIHLSARTIIYYVDYSVLFIAAKIYVEQFTRVVQFTPNSAKIRSHKNPPCFFSISFSHLFPPECPSVL